MAIFSYGKVNGLLTKQDLKRAASHVRSSTPALCSLNQLLPIEIYSSRFPQKKHWVSHFSHYVVFCPSPLAQPVCLQLTCSNSQILDLFSDLFLLFALQVCGVDLTDKVVDIIFHVFDANCDGNLSSEEFLRSLQRRESDIRQPATSGFLGVIACWLNCTKCSLQQMLPQQILLTLVTVFRCPWLLCV